MAKIYGGRWQVASSFAAGGQAEVFKVRDLHGVHQDELVLKRVRNPKRHDRFRNEVEAIRRLDHPNVIRMIDHSALASNNSTAETQFIVMPYASQGDLASRAALYANNPDSVVQVAKSIALGLRAAHINQIVHRDVKPENILFPTVSHDVWVADFGICLIRDLERGTPADEVVGPVRFMAPELEGGGQLDVSPAADVYSLGKVIFYMLSGGVVLPRERLHEPEYAQVFQAGERQRLFEMLLSRMICALPNRITSMDEVLVQLELIESWERNARLLPIQPKTMSAIDDMKRRALAVHQQTETNTNIQKRRAAAVAAALSGVLDWFNAELTKTSAIVEDGLTITTGVRKVEAENNDSPPFNNFRRGPAVELWIRNKYEAFRTEHLLRFSIRIQSNMSVRNRVITSQNPSIQVPPIEPEHAILMVIPAYGRKLENTTPSRPTDWQFLTVEGKLFRPVTNQNLSYLPPAHPRSSQGKPQQSVKVQSVQFSTANWPSVASNFPMLFQNSIDVFISSINVTGLPFGS